MNITIIANLSALSDFPRCLYVRGVLGKLWALIQWLTFTVAVVGVFSLSLVRNDAEILIF